MRVDLVKEITVSLCPRDKQTHIAPRKNVVAGIKALTFDVYGTLIDTADSSIQATSKILTNSGANLSPALFYERWKQASNELMARDVFYDVRRVLTKSFQKTLREFGLALDIDHIEIMFDAIKKRKAFPGVKDVCEKLKRDYTLAILSNADDELVLPSIKRSGLSFDYVVTSESSGVYKPDSGIFRDCLKRLGCSPSEVLHVGNSISEDVAGAKNAGMQAVWVNSNNEAMPETPVKPDYRIKNLRGLLDILK